RALPQPLPRHPAAAAGRTARGVRAHRAGAGAARRIVHRRAYRRRLTDRAPARPPELPMATDPAALTYLALGDSYTIAEGLASGERWPVRLMLALREEGIPLEFSRTLATTGWTTDELSPAMHAAQPPIGRYVFVSLLIGVNNQSRGSSTAEYRGDFHELLGR